MSKPTSDTDQTSEAILPGMTALSAQSLVNNSAYEQLNDLPDIVELVMAMSEKPSSSGSTVSAGLSANPESLTDVETSSSDNTQRAYASDWKHYCGWCRRHERSPLTPDTQTIGLYITDLASGSKTETQKSIATIERRLSSLSWNFAQRGQPLDRKDQHIATVLAGIRNAPAKPPVRKEPISPEDLIAMLETLDRGTLRGLRDRAMLLLGFAGGLRRSEISGLDTGREQTKDGCGWIEIFDRGILVTLRVKTGLREIEVGRGASDATCPVVALETWLKFARIDRGPLFRRVTGQGKQVGPDRLNDQEIARLVKKTALAAGIRGKNFAGHSLRAGLASTVEISGKNRFRINRTKESGL